MLGLGLHACTLYCDRRFRTPNVIDQANWECLAIEIGTSIPSARLIRVLSRLIDDYGGSDAIPPGQWPGDDLSGLYRMKGITVRYIQPGKPKPECVHRMVQPNLPYRGAQRISVRQPGTGSDYH